MILHVLHSKILYVACAPVNLSNVMNASWDVCPVLWVNAVLLLALKVLMACMAIAYVRMFEEDINAWARAGRWCETIPKCALCGCVRESTV